MKSIATLIFISVVFTSCHFNHKQVSSTPIQRHLDAFDSLSPLHDLTSTKQLSEVNVVVKWNPENLHDPEKLTVYLDKTHKLILKEVDSTIYKSLANNSELYNSIFYHVSSQAPIGNYRAVILCSVSPNAYVSFYPCFCLVLFDKHFQVKSLLMLEERVDLRCAVSNNDTVCYSFYTISSEIHHNRGLMGQIGC